MASIEDMNITKSPITIQYDEEKSHFVAFLSNLPDCKTYSENIDDAITELKNLQKEMLSAINDQYPVTPKETTFDYQTLKQALRLENIYRSDEYKYK